MTRLAAWILAATLELAFWALGATPTETLAAGVLAYLGARLCRVGAAGDEL